MHYVQEYIKPWKNSCNYFKIRLFWAQIDGTRDDLSFAFITSPRSDRKCSLTGWLSACRPIVAAEIAELSACRYSQSRIDWIAMSSIEHVNCCQFRPRLIAMEMPRRHSRFFIVSCNNDVYVLKWNRLLSGCWNEIPNRKLYWVHFYDMDVYFFLP